MINAKIEPVKVNLQKLEQQVNSIDTKIGRLDTKFEEKVDKLEAKFDERIDKLETKFESLQLSTWSGDRFFTDK